MALAGFLVNVTAGLDLNIGEFTEVGRCVEEFASPDATVVVGTVIDQTLQDEIKVTVVATGTGQGYEAECCSRQYCDRAGQQLRVRWITQH